MIVISQEAFQSMRLAAQERPTYEVSGFAMAEHPPAENLIRVTRVVIPAQEVGAVDTDISGRQLVAWLSELMKEEGSVLANFPIWWHSHAGMEAKPSSRDRTTLSDLADLLGDATGWAMGIIINDQSDLYTWMEIRRPLRMALNGIKTQVEEAVDETIAARVKLEMQKVMVRKPLVQQRIVNPFVASRPGLSTDPRTYAEWFLRFSYYRDKPISSLPDYARASLTAVFGYEVIAHLEGKLKNGEDIYISVDGLVTRAILEGPSMIRVDEDDDFDRMIRSEYRSHLAHEELECEGVYSGDSCCRFCADSADLDPEYTLHSGLHKYGELPLLCIYCGEELDYTSEVAKAQLQEHEKPKRRLKHSQPKGRAK